MFGIVPRVLWERKCPPDEQNRIRQNANCLFIDTGSQKVLIETGMGEKWSAKQEEIYGVERVRPFTDSLRDIAGCGPDDIDIVVNTHLHFDHAGGNTVFDESGRAVPQFPNATYLVSEAELERANNPIERDRASYLKENWQPVADAGQLEPRPRAYEAVPGVTMTEVRGHSATMQTVRIDRGGRTLYGFADLIPTTAHLPLPWIMGYDLYPVETLESKRRLLKQALVEDWLCLFYHDPDTPLCGLKQGEKSVDAVPFSA